MVSWRVFSKLTFNNYSLVYTDWLSMDCCIGKYVTGTRRNLNALHLLNRLKRLLLAWMRLILFLRCLQLVLVEVYLF